MRAASTYPTVVDIVSVVLCCWLLTFCDDNDTSWREGCRDRRLRDAPNGNRVKLGVRGRVW